MDDKIFNPENEFTPDENQPAETPEIFPGDSPPDYGQQNENHEIFPEVAEKHCNQQYD